MREREPSYWRHPLEDIEPLPDRSTTNVATATATLFDAVVANHFRPTDKGPRCDCEPVFRRFLALLWLLDPVRYFDGQTQTQVAKSLGVTRAAFSRLICELSRHLGLRNGSMKRSSASAVYAARQSRIWAERRAGKPAQTWLEI